MLVEGQTFKCHSAILAGQSEFFRRMLLNDMREKATRQIHLAEIDAVAVRAMLTYCYGGPLTGLAAMADRLLKAADQYDLAGLKRQCERALCQSLTISNCLDHLVLADLHNAPLLKPFVTKFVVENAQVQLINFGTGYQKCRDPFFQRVTTSVADPYHFDTDPDRTLIRIRIQAKKDSIPGKY